jgi:RNA recognition motif-containing protein
VNKLKKLYVGNLPYSVTEAQLSELFAEFGKVSSIALITDRMTGQPKGFGFVEMESDAEAAKAISGLSGKEVDGRAIVVNEARPKEDRPSGGFRGGYGR